MVGSNTIKLSARPHAPEVTLSVDDAPVKTPPTNESKHIVVIGGGVSGLMTAWILLDKGYRVTILSDQWAWTRDFQHSRLTSQIAGALWEFPPGGCGLTELTNPGSGWAQLPNYEEWALQSYEFYDQLMKLHNGRYKLEFGASMAKLNQFFYKPLPDTANAQSTDPEERKLGRIEKASKDERVFGFEKQSHKKPEDFKAWLKDIGIGPVYQEQLKDAYTHETPIINTDKAMVFLMALVRSKGADMETVLLEQPLKQNLKNLGYTPDGVINATGLGASKLVDPTDVFPVRGAIKRIANSNTDEFKNIDEAYLVPAQRDPVTKEPTKVVFIVPRNDEILYVGSIIQNYNNQLTLTADSPDVEIMWKRARTFLPTLNDAHPIPEYPFAEGLRPFSTKNAKVRADDKIEGLNLVHNYGHGGSGWTLAVGCARTAVNLLELIMDGAKPYDVNAQIYGVPQSV